MTNPKDIKIELSSDEEDDEEDVDEVDIDDEDDDELLDGFKSVGQIPGLSTIIVASFA